MFLFYITNNYCFNKSIFLCRGNYPKALTNYERGLVDYSSSSILAAQNPLHRSQCLAGIARMSIRCGDSRKGVGIAMDNESSRLLRKECAEILESMKVYFFRFIYLDKSQKINYILL